LPENNFADLPTGTLGWPGKTSLRIWAILV
jgi:hypothetical protein